MQDIYKYISKEKEQNYSNVISYMTIFVYAMTMKLIFSGCNKKKKKRLKNVEILQYK